MRYLAKIFVTLKPTVNDPQGQTILAGLRTMGFTAPASVRAGKYFEMALEAEGRTDAEAQVREICDKLLANPVMEEFRFTVEEG